MDTDARRSHVIFHVKNNWYVFVRLLFIVTLLPLFTSVVPSSTQAQGNCGISGLINVDSTFRPGECDPYIVTGNVTIGEGVTLTLEPGTTVQFDSKTVMTVNGTLLAPGTVANPITFTSHADTPAPGDWGYILFNDSSTYATFDEDGNYTGGHLMQHVVLEYGGGVDNTAIHGIDETILGFNESSAFIDQSIIRFSAGNGIDGFGFANRVTNDVSSFVIQDTRIQDNAGGGIDLGNYKKMTLARSLVDRNGDTGFTFNGFASVLVVEDSVISRNTTTGSGGGLYIEDTHISAQLRNNTIAHNRAVRNGGGIYFELGYYDSDSVSRMEITGNVIAHNIATPYRYAGAGGGIYGSFRGVLLTIANNEILNNQALNAGGGLALKRNPLFANNVVISDNLIQDNTVTEPDGGGAIRLAGNGAENFRFTHNILDNNTAGGAPQDIFYDRTATNEPMNARENEWDAASRDEIQSRIYDGSDDPELDFVDFEDFRLGNSVVNTSVPANTAASLESADGNVAITIPAAGVTDTTTFSQRPTNVNVLDLPADVSGLYAFNFDAIAGGVLINTLPAASIIEITLPANVAQATRTVAYHQDGAWVDLFPCEGCSIAGNQMTVQTACTGTFAVVETADTTALPSGGDDPCNDNPPQVPGGLTSVNVFLPFIQR
ncbi:MAG: right-handed parallel beta-helix repeat-containing protein [Chloroflexaceae bacterium]